MATRITQIKNEENGSTILRLEGEMFLEDALLLESIARGLRSESGADITFDLADLDLLDSESGAVLKRLGDMPGFDIIGMEIFLQTVVNDAEKHDR